MIACAFVNWKENLSSIIPSKPNSVSVENSGFNSEFPEFCLETMPPSIEYVSY